MADLAVWLQNGYYLESMVARESIFKASQIE